MLLMAVLVKYFIRSQLSTATAYSLEATSPCNLMKLSMRRKISALGLSKANGAICPPPFIANPMLEEEATGLGGP